MENRGGGRGRRLAGVSQRVEDKIENVLVGQRVIDVFAVALALHQPLGAEDAEALRDGGKIAAFRGGEFRDATGSLAEQGEKPQAGHIAERAEDGSGALERLRTDGRISGGGAMILRIAAGLRQGARHELASMLTQLNKYSSVFCQRGNFRATIVLRRDSH